MKLSVLQWNVWFREDPLRLADYLASVGADVLCLQELTTTSADYPDFDIPAYLAGRLNLQSVYYEAQRWVAGETVKRTQGNALLSRYPLLRPRRVFVQESAGPVPAYDAEGRLYVEAEVDLAGQTLTVGTAHLSYVQNFGSSPRRDREDRALLAAIGANRQRFIFSGDLNSLPGHSLITQLSTVAGLVPAGPAFDQNTWATKPFTFGGSTDNLLNWRLDYVFASPDVQVVEARVLETDLSDHLPILVTIEI